MIIYEHPPLRVKMCKRGPMMYFTGDEFVGRALDLYGEYSEFEIELFRQVLAPGATAIDAGAHFGVFTVYFAQAVGLAGRVFAFEPQRALYHIVCGNLALNGLTNVVATHAALGAAPGRVRVAAIDYARGGNFGGVEIGGNAHGEEVAVSTIDSLSLDQCRLIKIDVEGMERDVLEGAAATLARCQPFLYVENDRQAKSASLIAWLLEHDYRLYWHLPKMFNPDNHFANTSNVFPRLISINMFGVPRAMDVPMTGFIEITSPDADWREADMLYRQGARRHDERFPPYSTAPLARSPLISAAENPNSPSTSSVCSANSGVRTASVLGVRLR